MNAQFVFPCELICLQIRRRKVINNHCEAVKTDQELFGFQIVRFVSLKIYCIDAHMLDYREIFCSCAEKISRVARESFIQFCSVNSVVDFEINKIEQNLGQRSRFGCAIKQFPN